MAEAKHLMDLNFRLEEHPKGIITYDAIKSDISFPDHTNRACRALFMKLYRKHSTRLDALFTITYQNPETQAVIVATADEGKVEEISKAFKVMSLHFLALYLKNKGTSEENVKEYLLLNEGRIFEEAAQPKATPVSSQVISQPDRQIRKIKLNALDANEENKSKMSNSNITNGNNPKTVYTVDSKNKQTLNSFFKKA